MPRCRRCLLVCLLCLFAARPTRAGDDLTTRIESVINGPDYREAHWGVLVVDAEDGRTLCAHDADRLFAPASTTKLYSCAAALADLGADYRFETPVYRRGTVEKGVLHGDLILVASGDLTLGGRTLPDGTMAFADHDHIYANGGTQTGLTPTDPLAGLKDLARQVAKAGVRRVTGEVLVDDRLFARARGSGSGPDVLSPVVVNDNVLDLTVTPADKSGAPASVRVRPETGWVQIDAQVTTGPKGATPRLELEDVGPQRFKLRGEVPVGDKPRIVIAPVEDPAGFARALFIDCLRREGVAVDASPLQAPQAELPERDAYAKMACVARFTSPPLAEALKVTLKVSHNLYASTLPLLLAAKHGRRALREGLRQERKALAGLGVDVDTVSFGGGAGGANADEVTPRATVQLLRALAKRPDWPTYRACLPVLGVDGTLADVVPADSPARGKVMAKTGTLYWRDDLNGRELLRSKALAGTMTAPGGRTLFLALFVNDVPLPAGVGPGREGKVLGHLCEIIYKHAEDGNRAARPGVR